MSTFVNYVNEYFKSGTKYTGKNVIVNWLDEDDSGFLDEEPDSFGFLLMKKSG